jgi:formate dehydrogenase major subunit
MTNSIRELWDMGEGDCVCVVGSNTTACHPVIGLGMMEAKRNGARLVVIDPRRIDLARQADVWLRLRPGTDTALLSGIAAEILNLGLADVNAVTAATEGFDDFREKLAEFDLKTVSAITEIPEDDIREAARCIGTSLNTTFYYTMGVTQFIFGTNNVLAVSNLALLTGNVGRPKTGVNPLRGQNNVQGSCDMGALPNVLTGYRNVSDDAVRSDFEKAWGVEIPATPGLTIPRMFNAIGEDRLKGLFIFGENPMRSDPDITHVEHCLRHVDFLVVQDLFLTETAELADVVLPGASFAEKDGTFTSTERRVQRVRRAVPPVGNSRPDWEILAELLARLGRPERYAGAGDVFDEMRSLTPTHAGITYERLEAGGIQWPCPDEHHPGTPILHVGRCMRGPGKFVPLPHIEPAEPVDADYPLILTTGRVVAHYHTATMTRRCFGLEGTWPEELVEIHPDDAARYGIADGDIVEVASRRGKARGKAWITSRVRRGLVFMTFHFSESPANILTTSAADPVTDTPQLKICAVTIRKAIDNAPEATPILKEESIPCTLA